MWRQAHHLQNKTFGGVWQANKTNTSLAEGDHLGE